MTDFKFSNEEAKEEYRVKYERLLKIAEGEIDDSAYLWDATAQRYASKMTRINNILKADDIRGQIAGRTFKEIDTFLKKCANAEFHIALVGTIKAGKSTLINALLGYGYASTRVTPETASLTKFRKSRENYVKVSFYQKEEWDRLWESAREAKASAFFEEYRELRAEKEKDRWLGQSERKVICGSRDKLVEEIQKWTSSKSACHYFVKEVEVGIKDLDLPEGVVYVDTPGLDDVVQYRSDITRDYIDRANAVLVCIKSDALTGPELATISSVFSNTNYHPEKVYIIATQLDTLNRPKEDWIEQRKEWLKYLKDNYAYGSQELARKNLVPVSAHLYNLLCSYNELSEEDNESWELEAILPKYRVRDINAHYDEMLGNTRINQLKEKIRKEVVDKHKKLLMDDIEDSYLSCKESIKETLEKIKTTQGEFIEASKKGMDELLKKQEESERKYQEAEQDKKEADDFLKIIRTAMVQGLNELESQIKNMDLKDSKYEKDC